MRKRIPGCDEIIKSSKARHDSAHIIVQRIGLEGHDEGIDVDVNVEDEEMEWMEIMDEDGKMNESLNAGFMPTVVDEEEEEIEEPVGGGDTE